MKDSENPFAKAQREEKEAKQRLESRKRRKSPSPPQDDSTADKAKAVAEMISARLKANAPKTAEELEAERALEREAEARRVEEEARARKERIESGRKKVVEFDRRGRVAVILQSRLVPASVWNPYFGLVPAGAQIVSN